MPSKQALARRQKFADAKKQAGGYDALREESKNLPVLIYFDEVGEIKGISRTPIPDKDWKHQSFSEEAVSILKGKNVNLYRMTQDLKEEGLYHLEEKPTEEIFLRSETDALYLIPCADSEDDPYEIRVSIRDNEFSVTLHTTVKESYKDIASEDYIISGQRALRFYITEKGDPHFLLRDLTFPLSKLIEDKTCTIMLPEYYYENTDIYTVKVFNQYVRIT